jgi:ATP-binding cassette subfamily B protein
MKGKTAFIVSHRVSTVKDATHILVLDNGKIIEVGKHIELLQQNGKYSEMYQRQLMEEMV